MPKSFNSLTLNELVAAFDKEKYDVFFPNITNEQKYHIEGFSSYIDSLKIDLSKTMNAGNGIADEWELTYWSNLTAQALKSFERQGGGCWYDRNGVMNETGKTVVSLLAHIDKGIKYYRDRIKNGKVSITKDTEAERVGGLENIEDENASTKDTNANNVVSDVQNNDKQIQNVFLKLRNMGSRYSVSDIENELFREKLTSISDYARTVCDTLIEVVNRQKRITRTQLETISNRLAAEEEKVDECVAQIKSGMSESDRKVYGEFKKTLSLAKAGVNYYHGMALKDMAVLINDKSEATRIETYESAQKSAAEDNIRRDAAGNLDKLSKWMADSNKSWFTKQSDEFEKLRDWTDYLRDEIKNHGINEVNVHKICIYMCHMKKAKVNYDQHCRDHIKNNDVRKIRIELSRLAGEELSQLKSLPEIRKAMDELKNDRNLKDRVVEEIRADLNPAAVSKKENVPAANNEAVSNPVENVIS